MSRSDFRSNDPFLIGDLNLSSVFQKVVWGIFINDIKHKGCCRNSEIFSGDADLCHKHCDKKSKFLMKRKGLNKKM